MAEFGTNDPLASSALSFGLDDPVVGEKPKKATVGDYARGALTGFVGDTAKGLGYLLESAGVDYGRRMRDAGSWFEEEQKQQMTPAGRRAAETSVFEGDGITDLRPSDNWGQALAMGGARSLPQMATMAPFGGAAAGVLSRIPALARAAEAVAAGGAGIGTRAAAAVPSAIGYGGAEGLQAGAINAADTKSTIEALTPDKLAASPRFQAIYEGIDPRLPPEQRFATARSQLASEAAGDVFRRTAPWTAGVGMATGGGAMGLADRLQRGVARDGFAKAIGKGALSEFIQETPQSGGEAFIQNLATRDYIDPAQDPWRGVVAQAASGGAIGGVTGGILGGAGRASTPQTPRDKLLSDTAAIVKKHLTLPPPTYEMGSRESIESQTARQAAIDEADRKAAARDAAIAAEERRRAELLQPSLSQRPLGTPKDVPLADANAIFAAAAAKPGIFQTIEKAASALPEPRAEEVDTRPDVAAALKELQADPQQIFRIQKEQPEVYATIARMAGELDKVSAERQIYPREREALQALVLKGALTDEDRAYLTQSRFAKQNGETLMPLPAARRRLKELSADGTREAPVPVQTSADVERASETATQDYTPPQGEANNVQRAHVNWNGLEGTIEVPAGGIRKGTVPDTDEEWQTAHTNPYGYWKGTKGGDGMHVDAIWGPDIEGGHPVYVIDEIDENGKWRQAKTLPGFPSEQAARDAYLGISSKKPEHIGAITAMPVEQFQEWVKDESQTTKPLAYKPNAVPPAPQTSVATTAEPEAAPQLPATPAREGEVLPPSREHKVDSDLITRASNSIGDAAFHGEIQAFVRSDGIDTDALSPEEYVARVVEPVARRVLQTVDATAERVDEPAARAIAGPAEEPNPQGTVEYIERAREMVGENELLRRARALQNDPRISNPEAVINGVPPEAVSMEHAARQTVRGDWMEPPAPAEAPTIPAQQIAPAPTAALVAEKPQAVRAALRPEAWQMTRDEYVSSFKGKSVRKTGFQNRLGTLHNAHREAVEEAVQLGKAVADRVLADYPEVVRKQEEMQRLSQAADADRPDVDAAAVETADTATEPEASPALETEPATVSDPAVPAESAEAAPVVTAPTPSPMAAAAEAGESEEPAIIGYRVGDPVGRKGLTFYAIDNPEYPKNFGEGPVRRAELRPKRVLDLTEFAADEEVDRDTLAEWLREHGVAIDADDLHQGNGDTTAAEILQHVSQGRDPQKLVDAAVRAGYDAVRINEYVYGAGKTESIAMLAPSSDVFTGTVRPASNQSSAVNSLTVAAEALRNAADAIEKAAQPLVDSATAEAPPARQADEAKPKKKKARAVRKPDAAFSRAEPIFYSELLRKVEAISQNAAPAQAWKSAIRNLTQKGVKADEIEWSGINEWLDMQQGKVTKDQVMSFLRENGVRVEETMLGGVGETAAFDHLNVELDALGYSLDFERDPNTDARAVSGLTRRDNGKLYLYDPNEGFTDLGGDPATDLPARVITIGNEIADIEANLPDDYEAATRYSQYTLPGGQNYRELLLTLPVRESEPVDQIKFASDVIEQAKADAQGSGETWENLGPNGRERFISAARRRFLTKAGTFRSSHFDQPNILAHVRFNERTDADGKRVLFIEEIQSDWAQKGKREGFKNDAEKRFNTLKAETEQKYGMSLVDLRRSERSEEKMRDLDAIDRAYALAQEEKHGSRVPPAPFVQKTDAWVSLALRRMTRYAAENGFDSVAWTTGEQQAERYDLSHQVNKIQAFHRADGKFDMMVFPVNQNGSYRDISGVSREALADTVGKELAEKIGAQPKKGEGPNGDRTKGWHTYEGLDLKVGGEGMRSFYDKIVPGVARDILKKLGGSQVSMRGVGLGNRIEEYQVGRNAPRPRFSVLRSNNTVVGDFQTRAEAERALHNEQPGFDITPAMREKVMSGVPLFRRGPSVGMDQAALQQQTESLSEGWANKPKLVITQTPEEWGINAPDDAKGAHWRGTTYLAASAHVDANEARETFFHESWHFAVWKMGKAIEPELNHLWAVNPKVRQGTSEWIANNRDVIKAQNLNPVQAKLRGIDEALAQMAQSGEKINGLQRVIAAIQKWLRANGMTNLADWLEAKTDAEALSLIAEARKFLEQGEQTPHVLAGAPAMARAEHGFFRTANSADIARFKIPPAWTDVYVAVDPGATLVAIGTDRKGRTQYRYSAEHSTQALAQKFERQRRFNDALPGLMERIEQDATARVEEAHVLRLLAHTGFRIGSAEQTGDNEAIGATTLRPEHVRVDGDTIYFDFAGKRGIKQEHALINGEVARDLADRIASGNDKIFATNDGKVRRYLASLDDEFIVHDFRTWNATDTARQAIASMPVPTTPEAYWDQRDAVADIAATKIGDTRAVTLETYIDPLVFDGWRVHAGVTEDAERPRKPKGRTDSRTRGADEGALRDAQLREDSEVEISPDIAFSRATPDWVANGSPEIQSAAAKVDMFAPDQPIGQKIKGLTAGWKKRLAQGLVDQFAPLKELSYKAYVLARMTKSADGVLEGTLLYGKPMMDADGAIVGDLDGKGFLGAMQELKGEHDRFFMWVAGNRSERLMSEDREHLFTAGEIAAMKQLNRGKMVDGSSREVAYLKALKTFTEYNKAVMDIAEKTGLIDGNARHLWEHDFYVPYYRVNEDDKIAGPSKIKGLVRRQAFKKLKGGQEPLGDLLANTLRNWNHLVSASLANQAAVHALEAAEKAGVAAQVPADTKGATYAMVNGQQTHYEVSDPFLLEAISAIEGASFKGLPMKLMSKMKHYLTLGVTVSPSFRIRNLLRDSIAAIGQNDVSYNVLNNLVTGFKGTDRKTADYAQMLFGGGMMRFGTYLEDNRAEHVRRLIDAGVDDSTILTNPAKVKAALGKVWDAWQEFGDRMENVNRAALYKQLIAQGKSHQEAAFAARDMLDFSMQGSFVAVRFLTQIIPFLNARAQGLYKLGRAAKDDPKRLAYVSGGVALASIALMLAYGDDDEWKKREEWDRDTFWWFRIGDTAFRIPKPFEIGAIGTIAERSVELMVNDEMTGKRFAERMRFMLGQTFAMNPVPQMFKPMFDIYSNVDSFTGRQIETRGMERLSKSERAAANTSLVARALGSAGDYTNLSPVQIDALIRGYFGWLGSHVAATVDIMAEPFSDNAKPARKLGDIFVIGDFAKDLPANQSRYVEDFYKQAKQVSEIMADIKHAREIGEIEKARELMEENRDKVALAKLYTHAEKRMGEINKQIRLAQMKPGVGGDERRARIDQLTAARNRLAETVSQRAVAQRQ